MAWVGCLEDRMQWGMQGVEQGGRPTITTSQCCTAVSINTQTAVARFLGWHIRAWVGVHPGFWKTPTDNPVQQVRPPTGCRISRLSLRHQVYQHKQQSTTVD